MKGLEKAKGYKGLEGRVTAVQLATGQAANVLGRITPPSAIAQEHTRLLSALRRAHGGLGAIGDQISGQRLCTGLAVRATVGDDDGTTDLRAALAAIKVKLPGAALDLTLPAAGQKVASRPSNGKFVRSGSLNGRGTLDIHNGTDEDGMVTVRKGSRTAFSVYVRKGKKYKVKGVTDGDYTIYFTTGAAWDAKARAFGRDCGFDRFDDTFDYRTTTTATQIRWRTWWITLHPTVAGTAKSREVDPNEFPED